MINAVRYLARCGWRMLPIHFGFRHWARCSLFQTIHDVALILDRERDGREVSPTAGVIDSQLVKAPQAETRGYDAGKKIVAASDTLPSLPRYRWAALDGHLTTHRHLRQCRGSGGPEWRLQALIHWSWVKHLFADSAMLGWKLIRRNMASRT